MLIFCYKKNIASPCSTIQIIKILLHRPAALKQYLQYSGVTMQNYSRMQCNIFALHAHEKNCTVTPRFNNASPYARKRSASLKIAKKPVYLQPWTYNQGLVHPCYIGVLSWPVLLNLCLTLLRNGTFLKFTAECYLFSLFLFSFSFCYSYQWWRWEGIFCLKAAGTGIWKVFN